MKKNKFLVFLMLCVVFISTNTNFAYAGIQLTINGITTEYTADPIVLKINNNVIDQSTLPMQPIIIDGTTLVPVREVFEALGAIVDYKADSREVWIIYKDVNFIRMSIDDTVFYVNGEQKQFTVPPKIINGKTMIPLRGVSEGMGLIVGWDNATRTVSIDEKTEPEVTVPVITVQPAIDRSPFNFVESNSAITNLTSITTETNSVTIKFNAPIKNVSKVLLSDNRLIFDNINSNYQVSQPVTVPNNIYYTQVRGSQFTTAQTAPEPISRVVIQLNENVNFSAILSDDRKILRVFFGDDSTVFPTTIPSDTVVTTPEVTAPIVTTPTTPIVTGPVVSDSSIYFDVYSHSIMISKAIGVTKSNVTINDYDAFRKNIIVNFNANYSNNFGNMTTNITDSYIASYTPSESNGLSKLTVKLNNWGTLNVTENDTHVIISFADPRTIYDKVVVIDAGHGGTDPGTTGHNMYEKNLNLPVALQFGAFISNDTDIKVYYTRVDDTRLGLADIGLFSSAMGDLLFSVHTNAAESLTANGVETHYPIHANDATIGITSKECAQIVQKNLVADTGLYNRGIYLRDKATNNSLAIFRSSTIPSVLGEMGYLSNENDAKKLASSEYLTTVAKSYARSTIEIFNKYTPIR